ncbi:ATP-binding protein [uncultured Fibrobacter sp.]|uniref:ATP-binding protein n=1 Tax=uncultured Fibrobacter sp. TaxID=261512 RepID=UPI0025D72410|nr:ATP-binding protein [uncultured Fibrobacter sp.]
MGILVGVAMPRKRHGFHFGNNHFFDRNKRDFDSMTRIADLKKLRESEDRVEFKAAMHNYPFAGGKNADPKERRRCVLGYIVALANEKGGKLVLGMADQYPHGVVGSDFAEGDTEMFSILSEQEPDFSAKICEGLKIKDLDKAAINILKQKYSAKQENPLFLALSTTQLLSDLDLMHGNKITYAALILLGNIETIRKYLPQNRITVEFRTIPTAIEYSARKEFQEALFAEIDHIWEYINQPASNPLQHYQDGPYIYDVPSYNEKSIREALLNAICHRSYLIHSDVVVRQSPDYLEITNAGGFPIGVDLDNILTTNSVPRNKLLCEVLQKTGLIERSGQGVDKMFYQSIVDGKALPSYANTDAFQVSIKFFAPIKSVAFLKYITKLQPTLKNKKALSVQELITLQKICLGDNDGCVNAVLDSLHKKGLLQKLGAAYSPNTDFIALQNATTDKIDDISSIVNYPNYIEQDSTTRGKTRGKILDYLRQHPEAILTDLAKELQISYKGVEWHFTRLKKEGLIRHIGPNNGGNWEVVSENNKCSQSLNTSPW